MGIKLSKIINADHKVIESQLEPELAYEAMVILRSSITDEDLSKEMEKIKGAVTQRRGKIVSIENMGRKKLAYDVKKEKRGVFVLIHFKGDQKTAFEVQRAFKLNEMIIRYMTVRIKLEDLHEKLAGGDSVSPLPQGNSESEQVGGGEVKEDG